MGLKNFHLAFILLSILTALGTGLWCFLTENGRDVEGSSALGGVLLAAAIALTAYAYVFVRKVQREGLE